MPSETLQLFYSARPRGNRRRPKHPVLRACARVVLWIVAVGIVVAVLYKLGVFQDPEGHGILAQCIVAAPSA